MPKKLSIASTFPLPLFLVGICTVAQFRLWLTRRAYELRRRDIKFKRPFPSQYSTLDYHQKIYAAVLACGLKRPYTGELLRWDLISTWDSSAGHGVFNPDL